MNYFALTEHNDWEAESWTFFIPVEDNEDAIELIADKIEELGWDFDLDIEPVDGKEVDMLMARKYNDTSYMDRYNRLSGVIDVKEFLFRLEKDDFPLYKGGIKEFMSE